MLLSLLRLSMALGKRLQVFGEEIHLTASKPSKPSSSPAFSMVSTEAFHFWALAEGEMGVEYG